MKLELKKIHWSIWKSLASRKKGFWQFILRLFVSPDTITEDLKIGEWQYYRRLNCGSMDIDFSPEFWEQLAIYRKNTTATAEKLNDDDVLRAIRPLENDYLVISTTTENLTFTYKTNSWEPVFYNEEMIDWKCWLAYEGIIAED